MEVSSRLQSLLRPLLLLPSRTTARALQTLALRSPPPPPRPPSSFLLLRPRRLPPPQPHGVPSRLPLLRPFASVSPAPAPGPGRDHHLDSKDQGPPPAPLPPPPPEVLASDDELPRAPSRGCTGEPDTGRPRQGLLPMHQVLFRLSHYLLVCSGFRDQLMLDGASRSIDLRSLQSQNSFNVIPPTSRATNYVVLRYYDVKGDPEGFKAGVIDESHCHYMVVFQYGSIVLFNVSDHEADGYLKIVEKHASGLLPEMRKDDYAVVEKPTLETWMQGGLDYIVLRDLSIDGIRTIGSVLGQSIALDYYIRQVDEMVAGFTDINRGMEKTGTFTMERKKLFQLVGKHNIRFLQEILQNRKSDFLEWLIIILISVEILISVYNIVQEQM
ncbi:uncharacterized protein C2845_PM04G34990 [Panicum miliaceum]|uniref:DUF155 domain-containing protein n=1 Tax=Panicum miliaceum TaxID=4540 RepID=A0A3L6QNL8_PANMI|nr:uncharacterized protein C2845_PM04G34990 [Panicum miliaceum]